MKTATNTIKCSVNLENIAKNAIIVNRKEQEEKAIKLIYRLSDEKIKEIMECFHGENS